MIVAERWTGEGVSGETCDDPTNLRGDGAIVGAAVRAHPGIENRLHWVPGIAFRDECRVRQGHADQNLAVRRRFALNLLRRETTAKKGTKSKRLDAGWDETYLLTDLARYVRLPCPRMYR